MGPGCVWAELASTLGKGLGRLRILSDVSLTTPSRRERTGRTGARVLEGGSPSGSGRFLRFKLGRGLGLLDPRAASALWCRIGARAALRAAGADRKAGGGTCPLPLPVRSPAGAPAAVARVSPCPGPLPGTQADALLVRGPPLGCADLLGDAQVRAARAVDRCAVCLPLNTRGCAPS